MREHGPGSERRGDDPGAHIYSKDQSVLADNQGARWRLASLAKRALLVAGLFVAISSVSAGQVLDSSVRVPPAYDSFLPPAVGGSYADPVFSSSIKRLSSATTQFDEAMGTGYIPLVSPEYSTMTPFNQDNSRLLLQHFSYFGLYDPKRGFIKNLPFDVSASSEPRWSRTEPSILYFHSGNALKRLNVSTNAITVLHVFSEYADISGAGESDICFDGDHLVLAGDRREIFVYELSSGTKGPVLETNGQTYDSLYMTPDDHVTVTWTSPGLHSGIELFDRNLRLLRRVAPVPGHMDVTRDTNGDEVLLWFNSADPKPECENGIVKIRLADAKHTCIVTFDRSLAGHVSATDNSGWFFVDTYAPDDPSPASGWKPYMNEILQVKMDGTEIRRLAHHRSRPVDKYSYTPRVSASRDGSRIVFASNFGLQDIVMRALATLSGNGRLNGSPESLRNSLLGVRASSADSRLGPLLLALGSTIQTLFGYTNSEYTDAYEIEVDPATVGTAVSAPRRSRTQ